MIKMMLRADLLVARRRAQVLHERHPELAAKVNELDMLHFGREVHALAFRIQTTLSRIQVVDELFGQVLGVVRLHVLPLDHDTTRELEQRGHVVDKVARESLHQRIVAQRELFDVELDELDRQRGQIVALQIQACHVLETSQTSGQRADQVVAQIERTQALELTKLFGHAPDLIAAQVEHLEVNELFVGARQHADFITTQVDFAKRSTFEELIGKLSELIAAQIDQLEFGES